MLPTHNPFIPSRFHRTHILLPFCSHQPWQKSLLPASLLTSKLPTLLSPHRFPPASRSWVPTSTSPSFPSPSAARSQSSAPCLSDLASPPPPSRGRLSSPSSASRLLNPCSSAHATCARRCRGGAASSKYPAERKAASRCVTPTNAPSWHPSIGSSA